MDRNNNNNWKEVGYGRVAIHAWVIRKLGKPCCCEFCGVREMRMYHWANRSGKYLRNLTDWLRLCVSCHKKYDLSGHMELLFLK